MRTSGARALQRVLWECTALWPGAFLKCTCWPRDRTPRQCRMVQCSLCSAAVQVCAASNPRDHVSVWRAVGRGGNCVPEQHQQACHRAQLPALGAVLLLWPCSAGAFGLPERTRLGSMIVTHCQAYPCKADGAFEHSRSVTSLYTGPHLHKRRAHCGLCSFVPACCA